MTRGDAARQGRGGAYGSFHSMLKYRHPACDVRGALQIDCFRVLA